MFRKTALVSLECPPRQGVSAVSLVVGQTEVTGLGEEHHRCEAPFSAIAEGVASGVADALARITW